MELWGTGVQFPVKENKVEEAGWGGKVGEMDGCLRLTAATPALQEPRGARASHPTPPLHLCARAQLFKREKHHRPGAVMMRFQALSLSERGRGGAGGTGGRRAERRAPGAGVRAPQEGL